MTTKKQWWDDYSNIIMVASFMADGDSSAADVAYMVEKPWKFTEYYHAAKEHEAQT